MKPTILHQLRRSAKMALACLALAAPFANAQVVVVTTAAVAPVVTSTVTPAVTTAVNANVNAIVTPIVTGTVNAVVTPMVNAHVNPMVNPVVSVNPVIVPPLVMPDINPDVNVNVNPNVNVDVNPDVDVDVNVTGVDMTVGKWFATIKGDKIEFEFKGKSDDDDNHWSSNETFNLSDFPNLPKGEKADFSLKREAGTLIFNGKFEDDMGFGTYKFTQNKEFGDYIKNSGVTEIHDNDPFAWFDVDLKKGYIEMLAQNGYKDIASHNLIALASMKIGAEYIQSFRAIGRLCKKL